MKNGGLDLIFFFANHPAGPQLLKTRVYMCFTRTVCGSGTEENFSLEGEDGFKLNYIRHLILVTTDY